VAEARSNLTGSGHCSCELAREAEVTEVVKTNAGVVGSDEYLVLSRHGFDPSYLPQFLSIENDLSVVLELFRVVKNTAPVIGPNHSKFPVLTEIGSSNEVIRPGNLIPKCHFLIRNVPKP